MSKNSEPSWWALPYETPGREFDQAAFDAAAAECDKIVDEAKERNRAKCAKTRSHL